MGAKDADYTSQREHEKGKASAQILQSFLEYRSVFKEPILLAWERSKAAIALNLYRAFAECNVRLEDITGKGDQNDLSDVQISVRLLNNRMIFKVSLAAMEFGVANPIWSEVDTVAKLARAGLSAVSETIDIGIDVQTTSLVLHLRPQNLPIRAVTSGLLRLDAIGPIGEGATAYGLSVHRDDISWVVDRSAVFAEALFLRLTRTFKSDVGLADIAAAMQKDQSEILELLQLEAE